MQVNEQSLLYEACPRRRGRVELIVLSILVVLVLAPRHAFGGVDKSLANRVKSAFIVHFIEFTDWPDNSFSKANDPIVIGLYESDSFIASLSQAIEGRTVKGRSLVIRPLQYPANIAGCQVLVVGPESTDHLLSIINAAGSSNILTIGEDDSFTQIGGIIRLFEEEEKERFEVNIAAAVKAHLQISSKLLKLAKIVNN